MDRKPTYEALERRAAELESQVASLKDAEVGMRIMNSAVKASMSAIALADIRGRLTHVNPAFLILWGYETESQVVGRMIWEFWKSRDMAQSVVRELWDKGCARCEVTARRFDDGPFDVELSAAIVKDVAGRPIAMMGSFVDITARKQAALRLRESEEKYRRLHESMMDAYVMVDMTGQVTECNSAYETLVGYTREELSDVTYLDLTPLRWHEVERRIVEEQVVPLGHSDVYEKEYIRKDGSILPVELRTFLVRDRDGKPVSMWAIVRDLSERKKAEAAMRMNENRLRQIIDLVPHFIFAKDSNGRFILLNRAVADAYGTTVEDLIGKTDADFAKSGAEADHFRSDDEEVIRSGATKVIPEEVITDAAGKVRYLSTIKIPFTFSGASTPSMLGVSVDITARKLAEQERAKLESQLIHAQKMESVGRLAGGVAHDFNNMLTPIIGYAEMMQEDFPADHPNRPGVDHIIRSAERCRDLVWQLLAFARKQTLELHVLSLNRVIANFEVMLRHTLRENIRIVLELASDAGNVRGDVGQLEQILLNLAVNAQDAMPGGGLLCIETAGVELDEAFLAGREGAAPGPYIRLRISDTGRGMDADTLRRVFEPFFTTKEGALHTGLGLSTVYGVARQHGGFATIESEPGRGTACTVYLPRSNEPAEPGPASAPAGGRAARGRETILVVEDQDQVRRLTVDILCKNGYRVLDAADGRAAMKALEDHGGPVDLLITDMVLPDVNGKALYGRLLARLDGLRVLYMSGYSAELVAGSGATPGSIPFLQKPFTVQLLTSKVREVLNPR